nr:protein tyrosine phosphatase type IVA 3-like [Onthophagus taurus]
MNSLHAPTLIEYKNLKFLVTNSPALFNITKFVHMLQQYEAKILVRVCEKTYDDLSIASHGILVEELVFPDGSFPDAFIIQQWSAICKSYFTSNPTGTLAVHCESGLGRGPVLVAIALIELGMQPEHAIQTIRNKRRGAFNEHQCEHLIKYIRVDKKRKMKCIVI